MRGLEGRPVLVTGAASGIGRRTAARLAEEGALVAAVDLDGEGLDTVTKEMSTGRAQVLGIVADVRDEGAVAKAVESAVEQLGGLRGVVTSAGVFLPPDLQPLAEVPLETFRAVLEVNLVGTFLATKHALTHLAREGGAAVTIASTAGLRGHGQGPAYTASKGGVIALTRIIAYQYGRQGVRANCVCPGATLGEGMGAGFADPDLAEHYARSVPLGRVGLGEELASVISFLLSDDASYVNGQVLAVDGGITAA
jgi:meso-butanediol dehydrogenase / (S,S)-butanediol dehydrogenase / diacetyl reductase